MSFAFCICTTYGVDWQLYSQDIDGNFLYVDKDSIAEIKGTTQVWQKKVFYKDNLFRIRQVLGEKYRTLVEKITLYEIHCPSRQVQERAFAYYDSSDKVIDCRYDEFKRDWKKIVSGTDMVLLYRIICEEGERKSQTK
jgi:hypothetical protein